MRRSQKLRRRMLVICAGTTLVLAVCWITDNPLGFSREYRPDVNSDGQPRGNMDHVNVSPNGHPIGPPGEHHKPLQMFATFPGISQPRFNQSREATLDDAERVVGLVVDGKAYAFACEAMSGPSQHIVNTLIDETPVSVTYCDLVDCVRVLTRKEGGDRIDLNVGGLDVDDQLVFMLDGVRYGQSNDGLPLEDYPFERTTFGVWKQRFPATLVYEGDSLQDFSGSF